jgi:hypothetical protein
MPGVSFQSRALHVGWPASCAVLVKLLNCPDARVALFGSSQFCVGWPHSISVSVARFVCKIRPVLRFLNLLPTRSKSSEISPADPSLDGVGWPASFFPFTDSRSPIIISTRLEKSVFDVLCADSFPVAAIGVGHPVQPLPDVRCPDAVCAHNRSPEGVTRSFHVCPYSIEPNRDKRLFSASPNLSDNCGTGDLLSEHDSGTASDNEVSEHRPQVPLVCGPLACPGATERLAGARACPDSARGPES